MKLRLLGVCAMLAGLTACGFHLPHQTRLGNSLSELYIRGNTHALFYKLLTQKLEIRGVKLTQIDKLKGYEIDEELPILSVGSVTNLAPVLTVDPAGNNLEYGIYATGSATLKIPGSRPIVMVNAISRNTLVKSLDTLASANDNERLTRECVEILADQMVDRINYLGKMRDPDELDATPAELVIAKDEDGNEYYIDKSKSMTLLEALKSRAAVEESTAEYQTLSDLNNGMTVLNPNHTHELPKVAPRIINEAPESLSEEGFLRDPNDEEE